jgi:abortive infection bacteriophage resistance protein
MIPYTKPFLTLDQQIALLLSRGLTIPDVNFAKDCLKNIGYYRLSGYWYPMRESKNNPKY